MGGESPVPDDSQAPVVGIGSVIAGYRLEERIGQGGMAAVFRARDDRLGRYAAVKVLAPAFGADEAFRQRFIRESRAAAAVDDPCIIPIFEAGEHDGVLFIAMRYVSGGDVRTLLRRHGPLRPGRAAALLSPIASALDAAHTAGLVHRDVKPANMLLDMRPGRPDHVYLSDFGLSKGALSLAGSSSAGTVLGTPDYISPEQIAGRDVDGRADQYALACTAFELLGGVPPFRRDHGVAVIYAHTSEPPPAVTTLRAELPDAVDAVLARALAKAPADRYPTCRDFTESLRAALGVPPYDAEPQITWGAQSTVALPVAEAPGGSGGRWPRAQRWRARGGWRIVLAAGCALVLTLAGIGLVPLLHRAPRAATGTLNPVHGWLRAVAISGSSTWAAGRYCVAGCGSPDAVRDRALTLRWHGSGWSEVPTPDSGISSWLRAVSPGLGGTAWAVGASCTSSCSAHGSVLRPLVLHWNGRAWSAARSPEQPGSAFLTALSQGPAGTAWAAGTSCGYECSIPGSSTDRPLILHWNGEAWALTAAPGSGALVGVSANPAGGAWAVGYSCVSGCHTPAEIDRPLILQWNGMAWASVASPAAGLSSVLTGVSAGPAGTAWAVGYTCTSGCDTGFEIDQSLILHWNGSRWLRVPSPSPGGRVLLAAVTAASPGSAWAAGYACVSGCGTRLAVDRPLILHWDGRTWLKAVIPPGPGTASRAVLTSVTAVRSGAAWAAGYSCVSACGTPTETDQTMVLRWTGTIWAAG